MVVQHNLQAMNANRQLNITTGAQGKSTEKLSSGYKINRAADDAAGLSISEKMRRQIRGLDRASTNAQDGISSVQTAEGALNDLHDMLQRMNELANQASNGTNSASDRQSIQDEISQLNTEIDRVAETTKFNELYLLKGDAGTKEITLKGHDAGISGTLSDQGDTAQFEVKLESDSDISISSHNYHIFEDGDEVKDLQDKVDSADKVIINGTTYSLKEAGTAASDGISAPILIASASKLSASASKLETAAITKQGSVATKTASAAYVRGTVETKKGSVEKKQASVSALQTQLSKLQKELSDINDQMATETDTAKLTSLSQKAIYKSGSINTKQASVEAKQGSVTTLQASVSAKQVSANLKQASADVLKASLAIKKASAETKRASADAKQEQADKMAKFGTLGDGGTLFEADGKEYKVSEVKALIVDGAKVGFGDKKARTAVDTTVNKNNIKLEDYTNDDGEIVKGARTLIKNALTQANQIGADDETKVKVDDMGETSEDTYTYQITKCTVEVAKEKSYELHVGADADLTNKITVNIETMNSKYLGVQDLNVVDDSGIAATYAIDAIEDALTKVSEQRSALGAVQNRLEHTITNLDNVVENTQSAESGIRDTDIADEMVRYSKNNILSQAGQSMLAQANQSTQGALSLLG